MDAGRLRTAARAVLAAGLVASVPSPAHAQGAEGSAGWARSPYNQAEITDTATSTVLRVEERPGGVRYRRALDPARTYRVHLRGRNARNGMVLRISRDGARQWTRTPHGQLGFRVSGVSELEVLIYRHYESDDVEYGIHELTAEACDPCPGETELQAEILAARPALADALARGDRYAAAVEVMRWAAPRIAMAGGSPPLRLRTADLSAPELYYENLATGQVGVFCGGAADFVRKLLGLFGIPAFELDFGDRALYTHAVVVVPVAREGRTEWFMLDPTFDARMLLKDSQVPLPLLEALELWRAGRMDLVDVETGDLSGRWIIRDTDADGTAEVLLCGTDETSGWSGCGLRNLAHDWDATFEAAGHGRGYGAMLSLLARGSLFSAEKFGVPQELQDQHRRLREALETNATDVHVADLPLPPRLLRPPALLGEPREGQTLTLEPGEWDLAPGAWEPAPETVGTEDLDVAWLRCASACHPVAGASGFDYRLTAADAGFGVLARVTARNRWGSSPSVDTPATAPVEGRGATEPAVEGTSATQPLPGTPRPLRRSCAGRAAKGLGVTARIRLQRSRRRHRVAVRVCARAAARGLLTVSTGTGARRRTVAVRRVRLRRGEVKVFRTRAIALRRGPVEVRFRRKLVARMRLTPPARRAAS